MKRVTYTRYGAIVTFLFDFGVGCVSFWCWVVECPQLVLDQTNDCSGIFHIEGATWTPLLSLGLGFPVSCEITSLLRFVILNLSSI